MRTKRYHRAAALTVATSAAALLLSACGGGGPAEQAEPAEHNAADIAFAQGMIPHHEQAVEMAELAEDRAASEGVRDLAERIRDAQGPEIDTLTGWLSDWGAESHAGHDMDGMDSMDEMSSDEETARLQNADGAEFDTLFLRMMTAHHDGAIAMARTERDEGAFRPALDMADDIIASQGDEIDEMNALLDER